MPRVGLRRTDLPPNQNQRLRKRPILTIKEQTESASMPKVRLHCLLAEYISPGSCCRWIRSSSLWKSLRSGWLDRHTPSPALHSNTHTSNYDSLHSLPCRTYHAGRESCPARRPAGIVCLYWRLALVEHHCRSYPRSPFLLVCSTSTGQNLHCRDTNDKCSHKTDLWLWPSETPARNNRYSCLSWLLYMMKSTFWNYEANTTVYIHNVANSDWTYSKRFFSNVM